MKNFIFIILALTVAVLISSCNQKSEKNPVPAKITKEVQTKQESIFNRPDLYYWAKVLNAGGRKKVAERLESIIFQEEENWTKHEYTLQTSKYDSIYLEIIKFAKPILDSIIASKDTLNLSWLRIQMGIRWQEDMRSQAIVVWEEFKKGDKITIETEEEVFKFELKKPRWLPIFSVSRKVSQMGADFYLERDGKVYVSKNFR